MGLFLPSLDCWTRLLSSSVVPPGHEFQARAIANARRTRIDQLAEEELERTHVEVLSVPLAGSTIIDIRHPDEEELAPLQVPVPVLKIPFYQLHSRAEELDAGHTYMLYCGKGVMSRLHASHMVESGYPQVKVYAP